MDFPQGLPTLFADWSWEARQIMEWRDREAKEMSEAQIHREAHFLELKRILGSYSLPLINRGYHHQIPGCWSLWRLKMLKQLIKVDGFSAATINYEPRSNNLLRFLV